MRDTNNLLIYHAIYLALIHTRLIGNNKFLFNLYALYRYYSYKLNRNIDNSYLYNMNTIDDII